jgi:protein tyrosine/serine phosphatase/ActR/RegA family two-component response regulator
MYLAGLKPGMSVRILLVEDDPMLGDALRDHVAAEGWDVDWAVDLKTAAQAVEKETYSLTLLDLGLPDGCGLELLDRFKATSLATPSIIISASGYVADKQKSRELGAVDYLVKPFSLGELSARINTAMSTACPGSATSVLPDRPAYPGDDRLPLPQGIIAPVKKSAWTAGSRSIRSRFAKLIGAFAAILALSATVFGIYMAVLHWDGNFHTVIPGELYRSAQLSPEQLETYVHDNGIRTIVNLRGENRKSDWYNQEVDAAQRLGIKHVDFKMSARKILTSDRADQLVDILRSAPKPILIHCQGGADRSGLAAVIYSQEVAGIDAEQAARQLSIAYGHIGIPYLSKAYAMDESLQNLQTYFSRRDRKGL